MQRVAWNTDGRTSQYERHRWTLYPRLLDTDERLIEEYGDGLTTVMLTRRISPLDDNDDWLTPWECDAMLNGGSVRRNVGRRLRYHLNSFTYEWAAVVSPTPVAGTPHEHIYLWINDPDNEVDTSYIVPALEKHLDACETAYEKHHRYRRDGSKGAITYRHDPELTEGGNTSGAQYLASQLAHLTLGDYYDAEQDNPPEALLQGAALAWASPYDWFRSG